MAPNVSNAICHSEMRSRTRFMQSPSCDSNECFRPSRIGYVYTYRSEQTHLNIRKCNVDTNTAFTNKLTQVFNTHVVLPCVHMQAASNAQFEILSPSMQCKIQIDDVTNTSKHACKHTYIQTIAHTHRHTHTRTHTHIYIYMGIFHAYIRNTNKIHTHTQTHMRRLTYI